MVARTRSTLADWLTGLHLVTPGITVANHWLPDAGPADGPDHELVLGAVARLS
ncbi:SAM-dependent methyltransferase [Amycolatopsis sp. NPDC051071]|uniref:SAM-dependent methyltransferase n=1 Tax=Amycolatopsis sp. NPDC051071 TaxID=3154637 RepID=UPI00343673BA